MTGSKEILIVGAGPTGLVLALWLARRGVAVRVIDKTAEPGTTSRALVVHARTLELYSQLGIADALAARGLPFTAINLWARGRRVAHVELGALGRGLTRYPELLIVPQDEHERFLIEHLRHAGVEVERRTELTGFEARDGDVLARTRRADSAEAESSFAYLVGCDGAHSTVRKTLGIEFPGGTYERVFYVADIELGGAQGELDLKELNLSLDDADFLAVFPLKGARAARLLGAVTPAAQQHHELTWADVSGEAIARLALDVRRVNWFSTYHVHHRVASRFAAGRVFLAGDAAHVHSPVGGQGMNTGIGDAVNLAWKLADVVSGRSPAGQTLLDTYEPERIGFARRLVATTDRAFTLVSRGGRLARWIRKSLVPVRCRPSRGAPSCAGSCSGRSRKRPSRTAAGCSAAKGRQRARR